MERIDISINGCEVDFDLAFKISQAVAEKDYEGPMLICWNDRARDMRSPSGVLCEFDGTPGWEVYGENHGGRLRISINDDDYVFIYS